MLGRKKPGPAHIGDAPAHTVSNDDGASAPRGFAASVSGVNSLIRKTAALAALFALGATSLIADEIRPAAAALAPAQGASCPAPDIRQGGGSLDAAEFAKYQNLADASADLAAVRSAGASDTTVAVILVAIVVVGVMVSVAVHNASDLDLDIDV